MKRQLAVTLSLSALAAASTAFGAATRPSVPESLMTPPTEMLVLETAASGVQIYECGPRQDASGRYEWTFKAPEAELFDTGGRRIGRHYAGPTWESDDGSKVVGAVRARADAPEAGAIPWLLLGAKSATGAGVFGRTASIQRVHTVGGTAPSEPCDEAQAGRQARVAYRATYYFYAPGP